MFRTALCSSSVNVTCLVLLSEDVRHPRDDGVGVLGSHGDLLQRLLPRVSQVTPILWAPPSFFVRLPTSMGFTSSPMGHPCTFFRPGSGQGMESNQQTACLIQSRVSYLLLLQARRTHLPSSLLLPLSWAGPGQSLPALASLAGCLLAVALPLLRY